MSILTFSIDLTKIDFFNNYKLLDTLIENNILNNKTKVDDLPLMEYLIKSKKNYVLENLLEKNFDVNEECNERSPLYISVWKNNIKATKILLKHKADINYKRNSNNSTCLYKAVENNNTKIVKLLLNHKADPDNELIDGATPLLIAVQNNNPKCIKLLLESGVDINKITKMGITPLFIACQYDFVNSVKLLIEHKADINKKLKKYYNLLNSTMVENNIDCLKLLIKNKINLEEKNGDSLFNGLENYSDECVDYLIYNGYNIHVKDVCGLSPLHIAVKNNSISIIDSLIEKKIDVNSVDNNNLTALYISTLNSDINVCEKLLENKADPNIRLKNNIENITNPLLCKFFSNMTKIIDTKIDYDFISNLVKDSTPLYIACSYGKRKIVEMLLRNKADPNIKLCGNRSPLYASIYINNYKCSSLLLDYGADPDLPNDLLEIVLEKNNSKLNDILKIAKEKKIKSKIKEKIGENCPICLETIDNEEEMFMTKCYHSYHKECWSKYNKNTCPLCRTQI